MKAALFAVGCMALLAGGAGTPAATLVFPAAATGTRLIPTGHHRMLATSGIADRRSAKDAEGMTCGLRGVIHAVAAVWFRRIPESVGDERA